MVKSVRKIKLLLVDDEEEFLTASSQALGRRGFDVEIAPNGVTALEMVGKSEFDVLVLDVKMPDIDGIEVFKQIRETLPDLPVILLTGHSSIDDAFQTSKNGVADYLPKPIDMDQLAARLHEVVGKARHRVETDSEGLRPVDPAELIRVMLVDDEMDFLESLKKVFQRRNMEVTAAESGDEALALLKEGLVDVVVLDVKMPGLNGKQVLEILKKEHKFLEVIILTGHGSLDSAVECTRLGAFDYLPKPYELENLLEKLQKAYETRLQKKFEADQGRLEKIGRLATGHSALSILRELRKLDDEEK